MDKVQKADLINLLNDIKKDLEQNFNASRLNETLYDHGRWVAQLSASVQGLIGIITVLIEDAK